MPSLRVPGVLALVFALVAAATVASYAQTAPPPGPYRESCQNIEMKGATLRAQCRTAEGKWEKAELRKADRCSEGVVNINGILSCQAGTIPPGSYLTSCTDIRLTGTTLHAACANGKGRNVEADLHDANQCRGDIVNKDGDLRCVSSAPSTGQGGKDDKSQEKKEEKKKKKKRFVIF